MRLEWRLAALKNGFSDATAYRIEFLFEVLGSAFVPAAIQLLLWYALFKLGGAEKVAGMTYPEMLQYTVATLLFSQVRGGDLDFELQEMIRSGQLSNYLLRPVGVIEFVYLRGLAPKIFIAGICLVIGLLISPWTGLHPERLAGAMALALMGNVIAYQIGAALAAAAFFWEEAYSVLMVKNMVVGILSGEQIPLNFFPGIPFMDLEVDAPFYLYVFGPAQYALGRWSHQEFLINVGIAGLWMAVGWVLIQITWRLGIKRYLSLGG